MSRIAYVNGAYVPMDMAFVHIEDRGFQFADGVYEVIAVRRGKLVDEEEHLKRLFRSLNELKIQAPMADGALKLIFREVIRRNRSNDAMLYLQVTRGTAKRDFAFPAHATPSLVITCRRVDYNAVRERANVGIKVSSQPDIRWGRCDIKTVALVPAALAKQAAKENGGYEAILVDKDGFVTEGSSSNIWIVDSNGTLVTRPTKDNILPGITRKTVAKLAKDHQLNVEERAFTLEEARSAREMFLTSSTSCATPIVELDGQKISDGKPGPTARRIVDAYWAFMDA